MRLVSVDGRMSSQNATRADGDMSPSVTGRGTGPTREGLRPHATPAQIGRFVVLRKLGEGGMGVVYAAYDEELERKVAIKVLRAGLRDGSTGAVRMRREAQAMARLSHPNVVQVYEAGEVDGHLFLAMEFVQGVTLRAWMTQRPRPWHEVLPVFLQAGRGLAAAHAAGLTHRDFKPDNVMVTEDPRTGRVERVRVFDFGVVQETREAFEPEAVRAVRRELQLDARVGQLERLREWRAHDELGGQLEQAARVAAQPELGRGAQHAERLHATQLRGLDRDAVRKRRADRRERRLQAHARIRRAAHDLQLLAARVHAAHLQLVGLRMLLRADDLGHDDARERSVVRLDAFHFQASHREPMRELGARRLQVDEGAQPVFGEFHSSTLASSFPRKRESMLLFREPDNGFPPSRE